MSNEMKWVVTYHRDLEKEIRRLPTIKRILTALESLAEDPKPRGSKKIVRHDLWRIQVGVYRILYSVDEEANIIYTYRIGHRKGVYRNL